MKKAKKKHISISRAEIILVAIALALVACILISLEVARAGRTPVRTAATPRVIFVTPVPTTPEPTPTPFFSNTTAWATYQSTKEPGLSFEYPLAWNVKIIGGNDPGNSDGIEMTSASGTRITWSSFVQGLGGGCPADDKTNPSKYIMRVSAVSGASGLYIEEVGDKNKQLISIGTVDAINGQIPQVGPTDCLAYTLFSSHSRTWSSEPKPVRMWLQANNIAPSDLATVRRILGSLKY